MKLFEFERSAKNKEYWIGLGLLLGIVTVFHLFFINRFFSITEGWWQYYSMLMSNGESIYKDFYMFLTPLCVLQFHLIDIICGGSFLGFRIFGLVLRLLLIWLIYAMLCRYFKPPVVWFATLVGASVYYGYPFDIVNDYHHFIVIIVMSSIYFFMRFFDELKSGSTKKTFGFLCLSGILAGIGFLQKQVLIVLFPFAFCIALIILLHSEKIKNKAKFFLVYLGGYFLPLLICFFALVATDSFSLFLEQVSDGSSAKGSVLSVAFSWIPRSFSVATLGLSISFIGIISLAVWLKRLKETQLQKDMNLIRIAMFFACVTFAATFLLTFSNSVPGTVEYLSENPSAVVIAVCFIIITVIVSLRFYKKNQTSMFIIAGISITCIILIWFMPSAIRVQLNDIFKYNTNCHSVAFISFYFIILLTLSNIIGLILKREYIPWGLWILAGSSFVYMCAGGMSYRIQVVYALLPTSLLICFLLQKNLPLLKIRTATVHTFGIFLVCVIFIQKLALPYEWWGWTEDPIDKNSTYTVNNAKLNGFYLSERTTKTINTICESIETNSAPDSNLYTYPHIPIFNVLTNRISKSTFAGVHFFDVCSDKMAEADALALKENPPDMIVYMDIEKAAYMVHEALFRDGNLLGQRKIAVVLNGWIRDGTYEIIEKIDNNVNGNDNDIYVLKRT